LPARKQAFSINGSISQPQGAYLKFLDLPHCTQ